MRYKLLYALLLLISGYEGRTEASDLSTVADYAYSGSFVLGETEECVVLNSNAPVGEI